MAPSYRPTQPNHFNVSAATIQSRLEALGGIGAGNVKVSGPDGGPWVVRFVGTLKNVNQPLLGTVNIDLSGDNPNIAGTGPTVAATEVVAGAQATNYEICDGSVDVCQAGSGGAGAGRYGTGSTSGTFGIAVSQPDGNTSTGTIFLADTGNRRVNTYSLDGTAFSSFGSSSNFGSTQPRKIAVDSRGIVYASDSSNSGEIDRYDSQGVNGPVGFLASIPSPPLPSGSTTSTSLAIDPDSDGVGADEDVLYAMRDIGSGTLEIQQYGPVNDPGLTAAPTVTDATHGSGASFAGGGGGTVKGLAVEEASGRLFVASSATIGAFANDALNDVDRLYVLDDPLPNPGVVLSPVSTKTDTTATFSASVDPKGAAIGCSFEYSTDPSFAADTSVPVPGCNSFKPGGGFQPARLTTTSLDPNTAYFVRLRVSRVFDANAPIVTSLIVAFRTDSVPPVVTDTGAGQVTDVSARFVGTIDPRNSTTGYHFEYGTTPDLGSSTASVDIGGGTRPITVSKVVAGLAPNTPYFFRVVATNEFGTTNGTTKRFHTRVGPPPAIDPGNCSNQGIRGAQGATFMAECRAYEMVSPIDKNQGTVIGGSQSTATYGFDGKIAAFCSPSVFGDPPPQMTGACAPYISERSGAGPTGWGTESPFPVSAATAPRSAPTRGGASTTSRPASTTR